ncbi:biotin/lipoyl-binding protein [Fervidicoccus fontis]|jgi:biotin carboxyl carrier protein|uniref:Carboxyl transferase, biotin-binding subunit n=2 Tax=Fervidicoccus fontis TaxID=683846 RepID=I0A1U8_FERFK|nr:biotin/lipoyl-containing protein [Fervidicoccus fontis]AFH42955.1 Carboxyl transferase, biotin-binding subunit [Fervidicoccus fontis Kam940]MBE9391489.1 biotin/lipoyl-binding protein [Fervidicoccus fontis]PMB77164.1 MAG: acetyl-CoA carboxylase biotin carboxyl carrier protein subunit [Fervidicoccus fontis]HEW63485.1 biotin/lipoyl-binding protein [Fervidicoccus fontis]
MVVVTSKVPGKIVDILVKDGDEVKKNQVLLKIESMKMIIETRSPKDGKVEKIFVSKGDFVQKDKPLLEIS